LRIIRKESQEQISNEDINKLIAYRRENIDATHVTKALDNRFKNGSRLWLSYYHGTLAGYIWSVRGRMISPYFFPVPLSDAVLFDSEIFPEFRGKGLNVIIMKYILYNLKKDGVTRTYRVAQVWNQSSLIFLSKCHFKHYGTAHKFHILRKDITVWH